MIRGVRFTLVTLLNVVALTLLHGCGGGGATTSSEGHVVEMRYATNLTMEEHDGFTVASIRNPWDTTRTLHTYLLLDSCTQRPQGWADATVLHVPLRDAVVYSVVHTSLINELGSPDAITGVCDVEYVFQPWLQQRIADGLTADCGNSMSPNVERILQLRPGAVLLSPFENSGGYGKLGHAGIPIVECADYMETSPLGRAEWMKFYGRLFGVTERADSMFDATERQYLALRDQAAASDTRPKVLLDRIYGQGWNVPGGRSTMGRMITDAGGTNPFADRDVAGSLQLSPETVLVDAGDADVWLIRYSYTPLSLTILGDDRPLYRQFRAYREGNVFGSESSKSHIFDEVDFHPQWLLADMISILHPEIEPTVTPRGYFRRLNP